MEKNNEQCLTRRQACKLAEWIENKMFKRLKNLFPQSEKFHVKKETKLDGETLKVNYHVNVISKLDSVETTLVLENNEPPEMCGENKSVEEKPFTVYVMVGVAGAGKDTWIQQNIPDLPVLSRDIVRKEIGIPGEKSVGTQQQEGRVTRIINERMDSLLEARESFVVNNMHLKMKYRNEIKKRVAPYGPKLVYVYVEAPSPEVNKERRKGQIPSEEIDRMYSVLSVPTVEECDELIVWKQKKAPN